MRNRDQAKHHQLLLKRSRSMRSSPTPSEAALWRLLRAQQLGVRFRRQAPVGRYIADFAAPSARLIVEVDGNWHEGRARLDGRRDRALLRLGYRVLRLPARLVLEQPAVTIARIRAALAG
jgi:very-short-patch-repair endonuclease